MKRLIGLTAGLVLSLIAILVVVDARVVYPLNRSKTSEVIALPTMEEVEKGRSNPNPPSRRIRELMEGLAEGLLEKNVGG